jgi:hypothetical protein
MPCLNYYLLKLIGIVNIYALRREEIITEKAGSGQWVVGSCQIFFELACWPATAIWEVRQVFTARCLLPTVLHMLNLSPR